MTKRIIISRQVDAISPWVLEGKLSDVLKYIQGLIDTHGDPTLEWDSVYYEPYAGLAPRFTVMVKHTETDVEYAHRLAAEAEGIASREQIELAEYNRLKERYGSE